MRKMFHTDLMSYSYKEVRPRLFTEDGTRQLISIRDSARKHLKASGAVRFQEAVRGAGGGESWTQLACFDYLVEIGELREITPDGAPGQHRVFVSRIEL
jgi:hypothetical protein